MQNFILDLLGVPNATTPVPGRISDPDLERMWFANQQTNPAKANRIRTIQRMRAAETPDPYNPGPAPIQSPGVMDAVNELGQRYDALQRALIPVK